MYYATLVTCQQWPLTHEAHPLRECDSMIARLSPVRLAAPPSLGWSMLLFIFMERSLDFHLTGKTCSLVASHGLVLQTFQVHLASGFSTPTLILIRYSPKSEGYRCP